MSSSEHVFGIEVGSPPESVQVMEVMIVAKGYDPQGNTVYTYHSGPGLSAAEKVGMLNIFSDSLLAKINASDYQ